MNIQNILKKIKVEFEKTIITAKFNDKKYGNGNKAKEALIRSQRIIRYIHEYIKEEFVRNGVDKNKIYPAIGNTTPEVKIKGFLKSKNQDISISPYKSLIEKTSDFYPEIEKILTVNIRSQLSSLSKNIDTLYERTFAEALNLHLSYPKQCLGEVYLIPTHEYDDKEMLKNRVVFKQVTKIEDYIRMFQAINKRGSITKDEYKYERICLLIADFRNKTPKLYSNIGSLIEAKLLPEKTTVSLDHLTIDNFAEDLLGIYSSRFNIKIFT